MFLVGIGRNLLVDSRFVTLVTYVLDYVRAQHATNYPTVCGGLIGLRLYSAHHRGTNLRHQANEGCGTVGRVCIISDWEVEDAINQQARRS